MQQRDPDDRQLTASQIGDEIHESARPLRKVLEEIRDELKEMRREEDLRAVPRFWAFMVLVLVLVLGTVFAPEVRQTLGLSIF